CGNEDTDQEAGGDAKGKDGTCREDTRRTGICKNSNGEESAAALRIPTEGVLRMSYGYREGGKYVVMKGPLKEYQNRIARVNAHDRKAYLDIKINGRAVRAGFELKPKRYWFPDDSDAPMVLHDGTEVNLENLRNMMMGAKKQR
ncbi:hypothetical protein D3Z62_18450, partial [Lachnospiraceae bacterium]|nr:hypothetical protein [Lachnospiraceae bacterium]